MRRGCGGTGIEVDEGDSFGQVAVHQFLYR